MPGTQGLANLVDDARTGATSPSATPTLTVTPPDRQDQTFAWRHQTRASSLDTARRFTTHRLRVTQGSAATTALAEGELLAR